MIYAEGVHQERDVKKIIPESDGLEMTALDVPTEVVLQKRDASTKDTLSDRQVELDESMPHNDKSRIPSILSQPQGQDHVPEHWIEEFVLQHKSPYVRALYDFDWTKTPFGPMNTWSQSLCCMFSMVMSSGVASQIFMGPGLHLIYNELTVPTIGKKHPRIFGSAFQDAFPETWPTLKPYFAMCMTERTNVVFEDVFMFVDRYGSPEETYFTSVYTPLFDGRGAPAGVHVAINESTKKIISLRRTATCIDINKSISSTTRLDDLWPAAIEVFETNNQDLPIVLLYSAVLETEDVSYNWNDKSHERVADFRATRFQLKGSLGLNENLITKFATLDLQEQNNQLILIVQKAVDENAPVVTTRGEENFPAELFDSHTARGFGKSCDKVTIRLISSTTQPKIVLGLMIIGLNPCRAYDDTYREFIELLNSQLNTFVGAMMSKTEILRIQDEARQAHTKRVQLANDLQLRTNQVYRSEERFRRFSDNSLVSIATFGIDRSLLYYNKAWLEMIELSSDDGDKDKWYTCIFSEDRSIFDDAWQKMMVEKKAFTITVRLNASWSPLSDQDLISSTGVRSIPFTVSSICYPELNDDGSIECIVTSAINISQYKWTEHLQMQKAEEAVRIQQQQENFIDMTSHEMRNPLNAILQSADTILSAMPNMVSTLKSESNSVPPINRQDDMKILEEIQDAAQTIMYCTQHQKAIVDDILTLSKMDADLIIVTPIRVQPVEVIQDSSRIFKSELQANDINLLLKVEQAYHDLKIDWVLLDPKRLLQVLVNLVTNAIKFTSSSKKRELTIGITASLRAPHQENNEIQLPIDSSTSAPDDNFVFLLFNVQDTGCGMSQEETQRLFMRFSQASPKTHAKYGGSGLGLFISRRLVQLQGGEIGVVSEPRVGSTFTFFIKAERSLIPSTEDIDKPTTQPGTVPKSTNKAAQLISPKDLDNISVLLVEDNLINQKVLSKQLKRLGANVTIANHGKEALDVIQNSNFCVKQHTNQTDVVNISVVLMDIEMPVMGGLECTERIRQLQSEAKIDGHVPIIAVTANAREKQTEYMTAVGMVRIFLS